MSAVCASSTCEREAITAIRTTAQQNKGGLVHTIYQFEEDAPKAAIRYCGPCAVALAAKLTALTDSALQVTVMVEQGEA